MRNSANFPKTHTSYLKPSRIQSKHHMKVSFGQTQMKGIIIHILTNFKCVIFQLSV